MAEELDVLLGAKFRFEDLTAKQVAALADSHVRRFQNMIDSGAKNVRVDECKGYLALWSRVAAKAKTSEWRSLLTEMERSEIKDALFDGGYDKLLSANAPS